jgi:hypothetical protein
VIGLSRRGVNTWSVGFASPRAWIPLNSLRFFRAWLIATVQSSGTHYAVLPGEKNQINATLTFVVSRHERVDLTFWMGYTVVALHRGTPDLRLRDI